MRYNIHVEANARVAAGISLDASSLQEAEQKALAAANAGELHFILAGSCEDPVVVSIQAVYGDDGK